MSHNHDKVFAILGVVTTKLAASVSPSGNAVCKTLPWVSHPVYILTYTKHIDITELVLFADVMGWKDVTLEKLQFQ